MRKLILILLLFWPLFGSGQVPGMLVEEGCPAWDSDCYQYSGNNIDTTDVYGLHFKSDGSVMFALANTDTRPLYILKYNLATAWDLSTANFDTSPKRARNDFTQDIFFSQDGTKYYELSNDNNTDVYSLHQYDLSTAWDISSTSRTYVTSIFLRDDNDSPRGIYFDTTGTRLYEIGNGSSGVANDSVWQYSLSTPWEISSVTYEKAYGGITDVPRGIFFKTDGTKFYEVTGNNTTREYYLSVAWDITTASFEKSISYERGSNPDGVHFRITDGEKYYIGDIGVDSVYQYNLK